MATPDAHKASLRDKAQHELHEFAGLTIYLAICFGAIVFLRGSILQAHSLALLPLGFAAIKAMVTAKFILIGRLFPMMRRRSGERLIVSILRRSAALFVLLVAMTVIEEVALAIIHHGSVVEALANMGGGTAYQMAGTVAVALLILVPYVAFNALDETLGEGTLHRLLFEQPRSPPLQAGSCCGGWLLARSRLYSCGPRASGSFIRRILFARSCLRVSLPSWSYRRHSRCFTTSVAVQTKGIENVFPCQ